MTIYLTRVYDMSVENIGYALTVALTIGVVFSLGFGILADKFDKKRYMLIAIVAFIAGFVAIPLVNNVTLVVLFFALINCAYSVFSTVLKAWFADVLTSSEKGARFLTQLQFPEHWLDDRAADRHPAGDVQPATAVLAGRLLRRTAARVYPFLCAEKHSLRQP